MYLNPPASDATSSRASSPQPFLCAFCVSFLFLLKHTSHKHPPAQFVAILLYRPSKSSRQRWEHEERAHIRTSPRQTCYVPRRASRDKNIEFWGPFSPRLAATEPPARETRGAASRAPSRAATRTTPQYLHPRPPTQALSSPLLYIRLSASPPRHPHEQHERYGWHGRRQQQQRQ